MSRPALLALSVLLLVPGRLADLGTQVECSVAAVQAKSPPGTTITVPAASQALVAGYSGGGSIDEAANFRCEAR
jgi:hypothetical protein